MTYLTLILEFNEFTADAGRSKGSVKEAAKQAAKTNQSWLQRLMSNLGEYFRAHHPALVCGGLVLASAM